MESENEEKIRGMVLKTVEIENLIWECTKESLEKAEKMMNFFDKVYIQQLIFIVSEFRAFHIKELCDLFIKTGPCQVDIYTIKKFHCYFYLRNAISKDCFLYNKPHEEYLKSIDEYENLIKDDSLWRIIQSDDASRFTEYVTLNNISSFDSDNYHIFIDTDYRIIDFVCYSGSINILKYAIINKCPINNKSIRSAIAGGNLDIVEFLYSEGYSFDDTLQFAIIHHHNQLAVWLCNNFHQTYNNIHPIRYFNTEMFLYLLNEIKIDINTRDYLGQTVLFDAINNNSIFLVKYLCMRGSDINVKTNMFEIPIDFAKTQEMRDFLSKLLIEA